MSIADKHVVFSGANSGIPGREPDVWSPRTTMGKIVQRALKPLGYEMLMEFEGFAGFGVKPKPDLWLAAAEERKYSQLHIAFLAPNRKAVHAFYEAAIKAGAKDNGKPGTREEYHPNYYGAFVLDPDGHNVEACCHARE